MTKHYHEEALTVAWSEIHVNGWKINVTSRQGATTEDIVANVLALGEALKTLREKYGAQPHQNGNGTKAVNAALAGAQQPQPAQQPATATNGHNHTNSTANGAQRPAQSATDAEFERMPSAAADPAMVALLQQAMAQAAANGYPPAGQRPAPAQASGAADPGWCAIHGCEMGRREKDGHVWYSHKLPDGSYCKGKPPKK